MFANLATFIATTLPLITALMAPLLPLFGPNDRLGNSVGVFAAPLPMPKPVPAPMPLPTPMPTPTPTPTATTTHTSKSDLSSTTHSWGGGGGGGTPRPVNDKCLAVGKIEGTSGHVAIFKDRRQIGYTSRDPCTGQAGLDIQSELSYTFTWGAHCNQRAGYFQDCSGAYHYDRSIQGDNPQGTQCTVEFDC